VILAVCADLGTGVWIVVAILVLCILLIVVYCCYARYRFL
jgi:signal transduction histidine kinase